jgi:hypothetical protein
LTSFIKLDDVENWNLVKTITTSLLLVFGLMTGDDHALAAKPFPEHLEARVALSSGVVARVTIRTISFSSTTPKIRAPRWGAGEDHMGPLAPLRIISAMEVYLGDKKLWLPLSAYGDLSDPRILTTRATKRGFEIKIKGSDAGGAYEARLLFDGKFIHRRRVVLLEFPDEVWEETTYKFNTGDY